MTEISTLKHRHKLNGLLLGKIMELLAATKHKRPVDELQITQSQLKEIQNQIEAIRAVNQSVTQ